MPCGVATDSITGTNPLDIGFGASGTTNWYMPGMPGVEMGETEAVSLPTVTVTLVELARPVAFKVRVPPPLRSRGSGAHTVGVLH